MHRLRFEEIKTLLLKSIEEHKCEAEVSLTFADKADEYMIIIYEDHCSFQRCGIAEEQSGEYNYSTLDALYRAQQVDNIILERDWDKITDIACTEFDILGLWQ